MSVCARAPVGGVRRCSLPVGIAVNALTQGSGSVDAFRRSGYAFAAENVLAALLYAVLLYREQQSEDGAVLRSKGSSPFSP